MHKLKKTYRHRTKTGKLSLHKNCVKQNLT
nr:MAG TPA: hypothetical protein [Caudoviricetes sp.]